MKITATKGRLLVSILGLCGFFALTGGAILLGFFEKIVRFFMKKELILKPGSEFFDIWREIPIPIYQKIYIFNITNPEEFSNGSRPILQEIGPYVYKGRWTKEDLHWNDDGTLRYRDFKEYEFVPELSVGNQEEMIYTLNAPLLAVINYLEEYTPFLFKSFVVDIMNEIFASYNETLLIHKNVRQLIYEGYHEPMVADLVKLCEPFVTLPLRLVNDTFGILHEKKHIGDGVFTIESGVNGLEEYGYIKKWNNKTSLNWWGSDDSPCNHIKGTDGVQYAPGIKKDEVLNFFNPNLCRSIPLAFEKEVTVHGIKTYRFSIPANTFATGLENPENKCYCSGSSCRSGILPLNCKKGAPYVLSLPHFLEGEESLEKAVIGVSATTEHKTFVDVEPNTGFVLNAAFKIQLNGVTKRLSDYKVLRSVDNHIVPVIWISEEAVLDVYFANYFKSRVQTPILVFHVICIVAIVVGAFWTTSSIGFLFCIEAKVKPETLKHSVVLKTLNSVYTTVALWPPEDEKDGYVSEKTYL